MEQATKDNLTNRSTWIRVVYMILFAVIFNIAEFVIAVVTVVQFLSRLFTGNVIEHLQAFGQGLGTYINEIIVFLTYHTDDMPFPFAPWPKESPAVKTADGAKPPRPRKAKGPSGRKAAKAP